jgi:hypothetical protein
MIDRFVLRIAVTIKELLLPISGYSNWKLPITVRRLPYYVSAVTTTAY